MFLHELRDIPLSHSAHGLSKTRLAALADRGIQSVYDLLLRIPRSYEDRSTVKTLAGSFGNFPQVSLVRIQSHDYIGWGKKRTLKIYISDGSNTASLLCFGRKVLANMLRVGTEIYLWASFSSFRGEWQTSRFEFELASSTPQRFLKLHPIYPSLGKFPATLFPPLLHDALKFYENKISSDLPNPLMQEHNLMPPVQALKAIHEPESLAAAEEARRCLAYRELFMLQLNVWSIRQKRKQRTLRKLPLTLQRQVLDSLSFPLTDDQSQAVTDINKDLQGERPMNRLLQGDVGCGKTLVAMLAALALCEAGEQVILLAPTTLLARQHARTVGELLKDFNIHISLLHSALGVKERSRVLAEIASGQGNIIIGTHSLLSDTVEFHHPGLIIIDEQQRFGVLQRGKLLRNYEELDILVMTATPIPRTLALSIFGHMEVSTIATMPPGRQTITSHFASMGKEEKVYAFVERELRTGRQAYFVYPWIEESNTIAGKSAEKMKEKLTKRFPDFRVALLHSRVEEEEQYRIMHDFYAGKISILVATSVVEVGVDVANASCIVIEHSERFGLATLHQLRGRVGRGPYPSYAFFVYAEPLSEEGKKRLRALYENSSGFVLAEKDLVIRGPGEFDGLRQAGYLNLEVAQLRTDIDLLMQTHKDCTKIFQQDPYLLHPDNTVLRQQCENQSMELLA